MPYSYRYFDQQVVAHVASQFPCRRTTRVLDVGAGAGKYRDLLGEYALMDALEIWPPYVEKFGLEKRYRRCIVGDVRGFAGYGEYDLVIFGDVLEHLAVAEAQAVVAHCAAAGPGMLIAVPYGDTQGEAFGNPHEHHVQDDLTHELFLERYPGFAVLARDRRYGIYARPPARPSA